MPREWRVFMIDRRSGAPALKRDVTRLYDASARRPPQSAGSTIGQGAIRLKDLDKMPTLHPDSLCEFWEGWIDPATGEFDNGYYVQKHTGRFEGGVLHNFDAEVADYNILLDTSPVLTWPTDLEAGDEPAGFPPGESVTTWLTGVRAWGAPYDGVITFHFPGGKIDIGGIDAVFDTILLDEEHMPTMSNVNTAEQFGMFGFCGLRDLLDEVLKYARLAAADMGLDVQPAYGFRTVIHPLDPTKLCPQFYCTDLNNQAGAGTPAARYSITPDVGGGIYPIEYPLEHERDANGVRTEIIVMADGDRAEGFIWSARDKADGVAAYPAYYHRRQRWGGPPVLNPNIVTPGQADALAQRIVDLVWGPRGRLRYYARAPRNLKVADFIELHFPPEGQDHHLLPVQDVQLEPNVGAPRMRITVGERPISITDILVPRADTPLLMTPPGGGNSRGGTAAGDFAGGTGIPAPRQRPLQNIPLTALQNVITGPHNGVPLLDIRQNPTPHAALGTGPATPPIGSDIARLSSMWDALTAHWVKTCYVDRYGTPHKQKLAYAWTADGMAPMAIAERMTLRTAVQPTAQAGVTFAYGRNRAGTVTPVTLPFELLVGDELQVTATGVSGHASLTLVSGDPL
jgi:hypothetical protein